MLPLIYIFSSMEDILQILQLSQVDSFVYWSFASLDDFFCNSVIWDQFNQESHVYSLQTFLQHHLILAIIGILKNIYPRVHYTNLCRFGSLFSNWNPSGRIFDGTAVPPP